MVCLATSYFYFVVMLYVSYLTNSVLYNILVSSWSFVIALRCLIICNALMTALVPDPSPQMNESRVHKLVKSTVMFSDIIMDIMYNFIISV